MKITMTLLVVALVLLAVACGMGNHRLDRTTVASLDLNRYLGRWFEIARFDVRFERNLEQVEAVYELRADGRIRVVNSGIDSVTGNRREAVGKAHTTKQTGRLRVSFFWIFYSDYNVLALGDNYEWALVGSRSPRYLWILSRTPQLDPATLDRIVAEARRRGYDTSKLHYTVQ